MQPQSGMPPRDEQNRSTISAGGSISASDNGIIAGRDVTDSSNTVHNRNKKFHFGGILVAAVAIAALFLVGRAVVVNLTGADEPAAGADVSQTAVGTWTASDGTGTKTFGGNGAQCEGFYYHQGKPLDIGGPMSCSLSSAPDSENRYSLIVKQGSNQATFKISFDKADHAVVYGSNGAKLYELNRF
ncbi:hypothetical protein AB0M48_15575 [Lentzea sp. NPDC051208]|uniref:hypothetical protein n=1 Tax=Lentzea sp. NPDC051208 TaxID=3154642 RepID=UPI003425D6C7